MTSFDNKPKRETVVVGVRFTPTEATQLTILAEKDGRKRAGLLYKIAKEYLEAGEV